MDVSALPRDGGGADLSLSIEALDEFVCMERFWWPCISIACSVAPRLYRVFTT